MYYCPLVITYLFCRSEEAKRGRKLGAIVIIDLSEFSFDVIFHIPATKIYMTALTLVQVSHWKLLLQTEIIIWLRKILPWDYSDSHYGALDIVGI